MFYDSKKRPTDEQDYRRRLAAMDPVDALPAIEGPILMQLAQEDFYVPAQQIELWRQAMGGHGEVRTYATSHGMEASQVRVDRDDFLRRVLGVGGAKSVSHRPAPGGPAAPVKSPGSGESEGSVAVGETPSSSRGMPVRLIQ